MKNLALLLAFVGVVVACDVKWPNGTDTNFHWYQCNTGPLTFYNATPFDQTGTTYEYPIHLGKPLMVKCDVLNPKNVYSSPNLILNINIWSWGTSLGTCAWSILPTFGMLSNLDACSHGVTCPIKVGREELDVMVDFTKYQTIINLLKDDAPYQLEYAMHDNLSKDNICFMAQARTRLV
ncbi:unnamed protein product [Nippostrongylus brasiliensis]|uniref:ML domain-containing protein n=1 Tax=Nippostrongylus brasiliensis TaxID=27835 RepID=A0A0N4YN91_NIPBR|nr:hypothetical protein Q1695_014292 [Nippostrongylus brasiliensis]VDL82418.1 unnamed protein product [Nippostrongylus brasiliensis]